jgi:hypothetical protein
MSMLKLLLVGPALGLTLAGCVTGTPIVAGAVDTVGVAIGVGTQEQGGNLTVGYKGAKFAVVPVQTDSGRALSLLDGPNKEKGFSVFAMQGLDAKAGTSPGVGVVQVVAVGPAAETWARRAPATVRAP